MHLNHYVPFMAHFSFVDFNQVSGIHSKEVVLVSEKGSLIFASKAHEICRKWKRDSGYTNAQIAEVISKFSKKKIHQSSVSRWMGDSKARARLIPDKHAYSLYWDYFWSEKQTRGQEIDKYFAGQGDLQYDVSDYYGNTGIFTRFPYYEFSYDRHAINAVLWALDGNEYFSEPELLKKLQDYELDSVRRKGEKYQELLEIVESVRSENQFGDNPPPSLLLTDDRKRFLTMLFHYWLRLDDRDYPFELWEFSSPLFRDPKDVKTILIKLLEKDE
jgi:hypothetical protein